MATSIDQKNFVKTALRLPPELHAAVHESAQKNGRSYNAELVERIQGSFDGGMPHEVVFDQAKQILELRKQTSQAFFLIAQAVIALRDAKPKNLELLNQLQAHMTATRDTSFAVLLEAAEHSGRERGKSGTEVLLDELGLTAVVDWAEERKNAKNKPKP